MNIKKIFFRVRPIMSTFSFMLAWQIFRYYINKQINKNIVPVTSHMLWYSVPALSITIDIIQSLRGLKQIEIVVQTINILENNGGMFFLEVGSPTMTYNRKPWPSIQYCPFSVALWLFCFTLLTFLKYCLVIYDWRCQLIHITYLTVRNLFPHLNIK